MTGCDQVGAQGHRVVKKGFEFNLGIAQYIGVGRATGLIFAQEFSEHTVFVFGSKINRIDIDPDHIGDTHRVQPILTGRAILVVIIVFPVFHEKTDHLIALLFEQPGRYRRIDATRHADDNPLTSHRPSRLR